MHGGLILLELSPQPGLNSFKAEITVSGRDTKGETKSSTHKVNFEFPPNEQFFSEKCLE
jgi:hypothetical protein